MKIERHVNFIAESTEKIKFCNSEIFALKGSAFEYPFQTFPIEGEHDYKTCVHCQETWQNVYKEAKKKFDRFPLCCDGHKKFAKQVKFDRAKFGDVPKSVADKVIFTIQHITNNVANPERILDISQYIDYTIASFGQMPKDCGEPIFLGHYMRIIGDAIDLHKKDFPENTKELHKHFRTHFETSNVSDHDFRELLKIYEKWLEIFPFEISLFRGLKEKFQKEIPLLSKPAQYNPYLQMSYGKMQTKEDLVEVLLNKTNSLFTIINSSVLYEKGQLSNSDQLKLELILNSRKLKLSEGYYSKIKDEISEKFRRIVRDWYEDEKRFIEDIKPYLSKVEVPAVSDKLTVKQIALIHVYDGKQITRENASEIAANYGYTSKTSGEGLFQDYIFFCDRGNRRSKPTPCSQKKFSNKIELLESVSKYLSDKGQQLLNDELIILQTLYNDEYL